MSRTPCRFLVAVQAAVLLQVVLPVASFQCVSSESPVCPSFMGNVSTQDDELFRFRWADHRIVNVHERGSLGVYTSLSSSPRTTDVIDGRMAVGNWLHPTAVLSFFERINDHHSLLNDSDIDSNADAGMFSSAMSSILFEVVEFYDVNGDFVFEPLVDHVVQSIPLDSLRWSEMCSSSCSNGTIAVFNASTEFIQRDAALPGLSLSVETVLSSVVGLTTDNVLLSPRSMKLSIQLQHFPFKGYNHTMNTRLAVGMVVATSTVNDVNTCDVLHSTRRLKCGRGRTSQLSMSWVEQATVADHHHPTTRQVAVRASSLFKFTQPARIAASARFIFQGRPSAPVDFKLLYFAFDALQPTQIYWDPKLESGVSISESLVSGPFSYAMWIIVGFVIFVSLTAAVIFMAATAKAKIDEQERHRRYHPLLSQNSHC